MTATHHLRLWEAAATAGLRVSRAAELGVFSYADSAIRGFGEAGALCDLYEPVPAFCDRIAGEIAGRPNVRLFRVAVTNHNGTLELYLAGLEGGSTFAAGQVASPATVIDGFDPAAASPITVPARDFAELDDGGYDVVSIDVEGGEWLALKRMRSRPTVLSIETHFRRYVNPHLSEIIDWCRASGYRVWYLTRSDTVFFRGVPPPLRVPTRLKLRWRRWRMYRGRI